MSAKTSIEWTDRTWNPVRGCTKVSAGCDNCYAMAVAHRFSGPGKPYAGLTRVIGGRGQWNGEVRTLPDALLEPLRWRKPARIFVNSMSDLFHEGIPDDFIDRVFAVMALCPQHTFQILTKRSARMRDYMTVDGGFGRWGYIEGRAKQIYREATGKVFPAGKTLLGPLPHVWLGVSVEDQPSARKRVPDLLYTPAAVRIVSYEPALAGVDFRRLRVGETLYLDAFTGGHTGCGDDAPLPPMLPALDQVIIGGESGPGARPFDVGWARWVLRQRSVLPVSIFIKQIGALPFDSAGPLDISSAVASPTEEDKQAGRLTIDMTIGLHKVALLFDRRKGGDMDDWPLDLRVREFPRPR